LPYLARYLRFDDTYFRLAVSCWIASFGLSVDIVPELVTIRSLLLGTSYPAPFAKNSEDSCETALCSDPICVVGYLQAECFSNLHQRFGFRFTIRRGGKHGLRDNVPTIFLLLAGDMLLYDEK
jgi:hypothetical protein